MVTQNNLTLSMRSSSWEFTVTASKWCLTFIKSIISSLHLSAFSWSFWTVHHCSTASSATCIPLVLPFEPPRPMWYHPRISRGYIQKGGDHWLLRWKVKGQVLCPGHAWWNGAPFREEIAFYSLAPIHKEVPTQRAIPRGMRNPRILAPRVPWSTRSKAFL